MKSITNATHTVGGRKIMSVSTLGDKFSVTVEAPDWAAGKLTYVVGKSGRHKDPQFSIKPV